MSYKSAISGDEYRRSYEEFRADPDMLRVDQEVALLRTTLVQFLDGINRRNHQMLEQYMRRVASDVSFDLQHNHEQEKLTAEHWSRYFASFLERAFRDIYGDYSTVDVDTMKAISQACTSVTKLLEAHTKLQKGRVVELDADISDLLYVFRNAVVPYITHEQRKQILANIQHAIRDRFPGAADFNEGFVDAEFVEEPPKKEALVHLPVIE